MCECDVSSCTYHGDVFPRSHSQRPGGARIAGVLESVVAFTIYFPGCYDLFQWTQIAVNNTYMKSDDNSLVIGLRCELETRMAVSESLALRE